MNYNSPPYKRRNYFINKEFQGRYIFNYFLLATIGSLLFIALFSFFSSNTLSITYDDYFLQIGVTPGILFKKILSTQWIFVVVGGAVVVGITMILTHRVAGPFYRFEKTLDKMVEGDISHKIVLRKKDEGKELAEKINTFNFMLGDRLSLIESLNSNTIVSALQLKKVLEQSDDENSTALAQVSEIIDCQKNIQTMINDYYFLREKL